MTLREELEQMIVFEMSEDPTARAALLAGGTVNTTARGAADALNAYCNALRSALLKMADEVELLRGS